MLNRPSRQHPILFILISVLATLLIFGAFPAAPEANEDETYYQPSLSVSHSSESAIAIETTRMQVLYDQQAHRPMNIPAASKIMTALLAFERLPLDTPVTISRVAAEAETNGTPDGIILENGDKYPLEYLLLRLMFYDSNAAAIAIAEQISNVEEQFVELMNDRAGSLELMQTHFRNVTGEIVYESGAINTDSPAQQYLDMRQTPILQYSTVADTAQLFIAAMQNNDFARFLRKENEYLVLEGQSLIAMQNQISTLWTLSERRVEAAFASQHGNLTSLVAAAQFSDLQTVIVTAGGHPDERINDILAIVNACERHYQSDILVESGQAFTGEQEQTVDGEPFGLIYRNTVSYVRPQDDLFLQPTIRYLSFGPHHRPIQRNMTAGQVVFELKDGTSIAVDVGPDRQILSDITLVDHALGQMQNNPNLTLVLFLAAAILLLIMLWQVLRQSIRIFKLLQLIALEKKLHR